MTSSQRAVGRPRSFDENEMLDGALDIFWRHGSTGTTTRMLEAELGVTQSSLYNAFGSKQELLGLVLDRYVQRIDAAVVAPLDEPDVSIPELEAFVHAMVDWISGDGRRGCMLLNLLAERGAADTDLVHRAAAYRERIRQACRLALSSTGPTSAAPRAEVVLTSMLGINVAARGGAPVSEVRTMSASLCAQIRAWA